MGKLGDFRGLADDVGGLDDKALVATSADLFAARNALDAALLTALAEIDRRGLAIKLGHSSVKRWWARSTNVHDGIAGFELGLGQWLTGHPAVLVAMTDGELDRAHAAAVRDGVSTVLAADPELDEAPIVEELLEVARISEIKEVRSRAQMLQHTARTAKSERDRDEYERLQEEHEDAQRRRDAQRSRPADDDPDDDPDNDDPADDDELPPRPVPPVPPVPPSEDRSLNWLSFFELSNGRWEAKANLDKATMEWMKSLVYPLAKPQPGPNGERDERTPAQRNAAALSLLVTNGGFRNNQVTTLLMVSLADLTGHKGTGSPDAQGAWPYDLEWTGPISKELAKLLSNDGDLVPIVVDNENVPLAMGDRVRQATDEQRLAAYSRDRCCVRCGRPKKWCQAHHIKHWIDRGPTDLDNLVLLCVDCHYNYVHHGGWDVIMGDDGHPWLVPPPTVDPERRPIQSYYRRHRRAA